MNKLRRDLRAFASDRKWNHFHSPKNLSMALMVEAAELLEIFQWMAEDDSKYPGDIKMKQIKDEIGDVQIYLTMIADKFDLCPVDMAKMKIEKNKLKYPLDTFS